ncbi:unnamed protein product [Phytophthora lilii]|uniref:Unnamed protein product n=1 Tax=Phytophthora lilii TaxID=2077276 RepID=A0A9W7CTJ7_9STRA|nr:unnamed protein product [Phytophthora lilii]
MVSLFSKNYICYLPDEEHKVKVSAKGVQQGRGRNVDVLNPDNFETVLRDRITLRGTNKGFRLSKETKSIITYTQTKTTLNYYYDKRQHHNNEPGDHGTMGKIERFNRTLKQKLTKMSPKRITQKLITNVIENYNSTFHRSIEMTPSEAEGKVIGSELNIIKVKQRELRMGSK